jgi:transposase-like protein
MGCSQAESKGIGCQPPSELTDTKRSWGGSVKNVSVLVAIAVNEDGFREIIVVSEGAKEDKEMVAEKLDCMRLTKAANLVRIGAEETFFYYDFHVEHWKRIRTNNGLE